MNAHTHPGSAAPLGGTSDICSAGSSTTIPATTTGGSVPPKGLPTADGSVPPMGLPTAVTITTAPSPHSVIHTHFTNSQHTAAAASTQPAAAASQAGGPSAAGTNSAGGYAVAGTTASRQTPTAQPPVADPRVHASPAPAALAPSPPGAIRSPLLAPRLPQQSPPPGQPPTVGTQSFQLPPGT